MKFLQWKNKACLHTGTHIHHTCIFAYQKRHRRQVSETQWEVARTDGAEMDWYVLWPANDESIAATTTIQSNCVHDARSPLNFDCLAISAPSKASQKCACYHCIFVWVPTRSVMLSKPVQNVTGIDSLSKVFQIQNSSQRCSTPFSQQSVGFLYCK